MSFHNSRDNSYKRFITVEIKSRFTCGEPNVHGNTVNCQNIMARIIDERNTDCGIFVDLLKAFDTVAYQILFDTICFLLLSVAYFWVNSIGCSVEFHVVFKHFQNLENFILNILKERLHISCLVVSFLLKNGMNLLEYHSANSHD